MKAISTVVGTHPVTSKENGMKMFAAAGLVPATAAAADVPDPAFVDLAISVGTLSLNSASAGQTTTYLIRT